MLRLTARGRLVALIVLAVLVLGALTALGGRSSAAGIGAGVRSTEVVVVEPGQTLWDIAVALDPATDPRATIEQIVQLNGLPGTGSLQIGQRLAVPRR